MGNKHRPHPCHLCALLALCVCLALLGGCARQTDHTLRVMVADDEYAPYGDAIAPLLPDFAVRRAKSKVFFQLEQGAVAEAFDTQAASALKSGAAQHWYPQYLATAIIAVDRDRTDARIEGWGDLLTVRDPVAFMVGDPFEHSLLSAISYGLEGEGYTLERALALLAAIREEKRLTQDDFEAPILICFDYQAAAMRKDGRNMEIIVPAEGTFTYEKGLLSNGPLTFAPGLDAALLAAGLRLVDGRCDESLYPPAYESAALVSDFEHYSAIYQDTSRDFRREALGVRLFSAADGRENQLFVLFYIILVVLWTATVIHRAAQPGIRRAALLIGGILLLWITVRLIKYQLPGLIALGRYLWYGYYLFQLLLPLVLLWLAWMVDRTEGADAVPRWLRRVAVVSFALLGLVLTNDWHELVFRFDPLSTNWSADYSYGLGFYLVMVGYILPILIAVAMLVVKGIRNPRRRAFVFPLAFCALLLLYAYGYVTRVPIAWESDYTMTVGLFTLLFMEAALRTGMIPVNTKYAALLEHSTLNMQIVNPEGALALASAGALPHDDKLLQKAILISPVPVQQDDNTLLFASPVTGGHALWQEDIGALTRLHGEIAESVRSQNAANEVLRRQQAMRRDLDESAAKTQLMAQLEGEIAGYIALLNNMAGGLSDAADRKKETARIALLLCTVKRRCNLFFLEKEELPLPAAELAVYLEELGELAALAGTQVHVGSTCKAGLELRCATLLYDFAYDVFDWASAHHCAALLAHLTCDPKEITLRLLPSEQADTYRMNEALAAAVSLAGGALVTTDLDDATGLSLTFPMGGEAHA